jgi:outer membrane protein
MAVGALLVLALLPAGGRAAETFKVGIVDQRAVLEKSKSGKRDMDRLRELATARERIIQSDEEELKRLQGDLQSGTLPAEERAQKQAQLQGKVEAYQRRIEEFRRELQTRNQQLFEEYTKKIAEVTADVAKKGGFAAVMDTGNPETVRIVVYSHKGIDLTEQVIKEFDRRYP